MNDADLEKLIANGDIIIKEAYVALDRFNWTEEELNSYEQELKRVWDNAAAEDFKREKAELRLAAAVAEGMEKGIEEGKKVQAIEIARNLLSAGVGIDIISSTTGLSEAELKEIKS